MRPDDGEHDDDDDGMLMGGEVRWKDMPAHDAHTWEPPAEPEAPAEESVEAPPPDTSAHEDD